MRGAASIVVLASVTAWSGVAFADGSETDKQIAQSLFDDGRTLMEAKKYAEACPKFAESQRLDPGGGTLLNLALCHELEGKTATAWTEFRDALSQATRDDRKDRLELANQHIAALGPRLIRLLVTVPPAIAGREPDVTLDRSRLPAAAWNTAIPVDPGEHRVTVVARGLPPWDTSVTATDEGRTYRVDVPESLDRPSTDCPPNTLREGNRCVDGSGPRESRGRSTAFWLVLGGAGVSLATSAVTGLMALDANKYVKDNCDAMRDFCRVSNASDEASRARTLAWVSTATLIVGAAAGVTAFLLPLEKKSPVSAGMAFDAGSPTAAIRYSPAWW